jgi:hypothetical protein
MRLIRIAAKHSGFEHLEGSDGQAFTAFVEASALFGFVAPFCAGAGVEQDGEEKEVDEAAGAFLVVDTEGPEGEQLVDARAATDLKVLPAAVRRDGVVVGGKVSLFGVLVASS